MASDRTRRGRGSASRPPRLATRVLLSLLPRPERDWVLGDLAEEFARRSREEDAAAARRWYRREVGRSVLPSLAMRARRAVARRTPGHSDRALPGPGPRFSPGERSARDLAYAVRRLSRAPGFTAAATLTLAVGIGATVCVFTLVDGVLISPLPYPQASRLVMLGHRTAGAGLGAGDLSDGLYAHYREHNRVFEEMALWQEAFVNLDGSDGEAERAELVLATPSLLSLLGIRPMLGSGFSPEDTGGRAVLLSHGLWMRRYGGDRSVVGRTTFVNGAPRRIAGVMPRDFHFPRPGIDLWMDLGFEAGDLRVTSFYYRGGARLAPHVTPEQAQVELARLVGSVEGGFPDATPDRLAALGLSPVVTPMKDDVVGDVGTTLWLLLGTIGFVLLIATANVANLHLVRAASSEREVTVRTALGASRWDLVRHLMAENLLLALAGGTLGTLVAWATVGAFVARAPVELPRLHEVAVDLRSLGFALALTAMLGVVFGLVHAGRTLAGRGAACLLGRDRALGRSPDRQRVQRTLVTVQVALALAVVVGATLMVRTSVELARVQPGFEAEGVLTFEVALPFLGYETHELGAAFQLELLDSLRAIPGAVSVGAVGGLPMTATEGGSAWTSAARYAGHLEVEGRPMRDDDPEVRIRTVTDGYFETLGIPIIAGRAPERDPGEAGEATVAVSEGLAERLVPGGDVIGRRVRGARSADTAWATIASVVADVREEGPAAPAPDLVYVPLRSERTFTGAGPGYLAFAVRTAGPPTALAGAVRRAVGMLDPAMPVGSLRTMGDIVSARSARTTFALTLLLASGAAALFLGAIGLYGVMAHAVEQRRREIGVRIALGAHRQEVVGLVVRDGVALVALGLLIGIVTSLALGGFMRHLLFGVSPTDPLTFASASMLLLAVAIAACALPARRAAGVEPVEALRAE